MDFHTLSDTSDSRRPIRLPLAGYQVIALHRDQSRSLVTLAQNLRAATTLAKDFCDAIERGGHRDGIATVRVEEWVGTLTEGEWVPVSLRHGGFSHRFVRSAIPGSATNAARRCPQRATRLSASSWTGRPAREAGGRELLKCRAEGPITNTADVPKSAKPGQIVTLRVGVIDHEGKRVQFHCTPVTTQVTGEPTLPALGDEARQPRPRARAGHPGPGLGLFPQRDRSNPKNTIP